MFRAIATATSTVYEEIRQAIKESVVVVLSPGQAVLQQCTMVLISVRTHSSQAVMHAVTKQ
jgi:hypothetical protein